MSFLHSLRRISAVGALALLALPLTGAAAIGPVAVSYLPAWETNGPVTGVVRVGSSIFMGGRFSYVGPHTGGGVFTTPDDATPDPTFPAFDGVPATGGGGVRSVVDDGNGGYYVGGDFTRVGRLSLPYLAHVFANGIVDGAWQPAPDKPILQLARAGTTLFVAGSFTSIAGQARGNFASFDTSSKTLTGWNPTEQLSGLNGIAAVGAKVYVAGTAKVSGVDKTGLLAFDTVAAGHLVATLATGQPSAPAVLGTTLYVGGSFRVPGEATDRYAAAFDGATGALTAWSPPNPSLLRTRFFSDGEGLVYAGYRGTGLNPETTLALDPVTGAVIRSRPVDETNGDLVGAGGGRLYTVASSGYPLSGSYEIRAWGSSTGARQPWTLSTETGPRIVASVNGHVVVGGPFLEAGGASRNGFVELDAETGRATAFDPNRNDYGAAIPRAVDGTTVYVSVGASFAGLPRSGLAAFDAVSHTVLPWAPAVACSVCNGNGYAGQIAAADVMGHRLYFTGSFDHVNGDARADIAAVDTATGATSPFAAQLQGTMRALVATPMAIYVGGTFATLAGPFRQNLAAFDPATGATTGWNPAPDNEVYGLAVAGSTVYAGGWFLRVNGVFRGHVAAWNTDGSLSSWAPSVEAVVNGIAFGGGILFIASQPGTIAGTPTNGIAALDATTAARVPFPDIGKIGGTVVSVFTPAASDWVAFGLPSASDFGGLDHSGVATFSVQHAAEELPSAPTGVSATAAIGQATVSFTPPPTGTAGPIDSYLVTAAPGGKTAVGSGSPITITGLSGSTNYTFTVRAANPAGYGPASSPSNTVVPADPPGAPTAVTAAGGEAQATVDFTAPASDGGAPILTYTATASPGGSSASGTGAPITVLGLTDGVSYTFSVTATNGAGTGSPSGPSGPVTPARTPREHPAPPAGAPRPPEPDAVAPGGQRPPPPGH